VKATDTIAKGLEEVARWNNDKTLYWYFNKLRGSSQSGLAPVKDRNEATISDKKKGKKK